MRGRRDWALSEAAGILRGMRGQAPAWASDGLLGSCPCEAARGLGLSRHPWAEAATLASLEPVQAISWRSVHADARRCRRRDRCNIFVPRRAVAAAIMIAEVVIDVLLPTERL